MRLASGRCSRKEKAKGIEQKVYCSSFNCPWFYYLAYHATCSCVESRCSRYLGWFSQQGDIEQSVSGFGTLKSKTTRLLTSYSSAVVDEIVLRPGAIVTPDSVIMRLSDPEIEQAVCRNMIEQQGGTLKLRNKEQSSGVQVLLRISTFENR